MGSGVRRAVLAAFCALIGLVWAASLSFASVEFVLASKRLDDIGPAVAGYVFLIAEGGCALLVRWRIRQAVEALSSAWTVVAVVGALCLAVVNTYAGAVIA